MLSNFQQLMSNLPDRHKIKWNNVEIERTGFGSFFNVNFRQGSTIIDMNFDSDIIPEYVQIQNGDHSESSDIFITPRKSDFIYLQKKAEEIMLVALRSSWDEMQKVFSPLTPND